MAAKPETLFRKRVDKFLDSMVPRVYHISIQQRAIRGCPDKLLCIRGFFVALELKASGGKLSPLQKHHLSRIIDSNGVALGVTPENFESIKTILEHMNT